MAETPPRQPRNPKSFTPELNPEFSNIPAEAEQPTRTDRALHLGWEFLKTIGFIVLAAFIIRAFLIQPFIVQGESMEPDFQDSNYLLVDQVTYRLAKPSRGDVVVFKAPPDPAENYIKRVVGLPGETVELRSGKVVVSNSAHPEGVTIDEPYIQAGLPTLPESDQSRWQLGDGEYFVLGDNRGPDKSSDSRAWGPLPKDNLIGKVWLRAYPLADFGIIRHQSFPALSFVNQLRQPLQAT